MRDEFNEEETRPVVSYTEQSSESSECFPREEEMLRTPLLIVCLDFVFLLRDRKIAFVSKCVGVAALKKNFALR